jgi:hypothetical protein
MKQNNNDGNKTVGFYVVLFSVIRAGTPIKCRFEAPDGAAGARRISCITARNESETCLKPHFCPKCKPGLSHFSLLSDPTMRNPESAPQSNPNVYLCWESKRRGENVVSCHLSWSKVRNKSATS